MKKWIWRNGPNWRGIAVVIALVMMIIAISGTIGRRYERAVAKAVISARQEDLIKKNAEDIEEVKLEVKDIQNNEMALWKENDKKLSEVNVKLAKVITDLEWVKKGVYQLLNEP